MPNKDQKSSVEYYCLGCDYSTSRLSQYDRHLLTAKHKRMQNEDQKGQKTFRCIICDYTTCHSAKYSRHLTTGKHLRLQEKLKKGTEGTDNSSAPGVEPDYHPIIRNICICGKEYKFRQSLQKHKKICSGKETPKDTLENLLTPANMMELIVNIVKSNEDIKQLMVKQLEHHMETEKRHLEHHMETQKRQLEHHMETEKRLLEIAKEPRNSHSNNHSNNNNNNNNNFNLQFFLNETCKDAINVSEFIENIKIEFSDVENVGKKGYITGITDMIVKNLADLGTTKRPFHCTDTKRETIYIKDNNKWDKDTESKENFQRVLNQIYNKNWNTLRSWAYANPEIRTLDSRENILYHKILEQTDCIKGLDKLPDANEKIIRKLSETIKVDK